VRPPAAQAVTGALRDGGEEVLQRLSGVMQVRDGD
jgi:hypothetical protein